MAFSKTQSLHWFNTQKVAVAKVLLSKNKGYEQGLTLLECLVGIIVVAAVIAAITPPIFLTMATRVQNRRADQAKQLAQAEVDLVRRIVEKGNYKKEQLPPSVGGTKDLSTENAPSSNIWNRTIDINGDKNDDYKNDFVIQTFRNDGVEDPVTKRTVAFTLGVRVYVSIQGQTFEKEPASLGWTSATGSQKRRPLAVLYTPIVLSDTEDSLIHLRESLK